MTEEISFYRADERPYGCFSCLSRHPVFFEGRLYRSAEDAYQAGKPRRDAVREWLLSAPSPALVAMAAHGLYYWDVAPGWSKKRYERMAAVIAAKAEQHEDVRAVLRSTGTARIVERGTIDNAVNRRWGEVVRRKKVGDGFVEVRVGRNCLGRIWMARRDKLFGSAPASLGCLADEGDDRKILGGVA